jgi:hypothetical protein
MPRDEQVDSHPSYGMVGVSHVQSNGTYLVGSEFKHHHFVTLKIYRAEKRRDLSREWWFGRKQVIEIALSEAQFIELMARPNMGDGVPCTLSYIEGEGDIPAPPVPETEQDKFRADFKKDAQQCVSEIDAAVNELNKAIASGKIGKTQLKEISDKLKYAAKKVSDGIPFVAKSFEQRMETVTHHAKAEIEATVTNMAIRLGVDAMKEIGKTQPKMIEGE